MMAKATCAWCRKPLNGYRVSRVRGRYLVDYCCKRCAMQHKLWRNPQHMRATVARVREGT